MIKSPMINLTASDRAYLPMHAETFAPGRPMHYDLSRPSTAATATTALVFDNPPAGETHVPGMCDYLMVVRDRAQSSLSRPPLVKIATRRGARGEPLVVLKTTITEHPISRAIDGAVRELALTSDSQMSIGDVLVTATTATTADPDESD